MASYCNHARACPPDNVHRIYHDQEYGSPIRGNDNALFGRLLLEINQAGLSWDTILKKQQNFERSYDQYDVSRIANYGIGDRRRLMSDSGVIRNRLKIEAAIDNARRVLVIQDELGSFSAWLDHHHPRAIEEWVRLFKKTFRFTGGQIVREFLLSTGYLAGAHDDDCPRWRPIN